MVGRHHEPERIVEQRLDLEAFVDRGRRVEAPPTEALSGEALAEHARALAPHAVTGYSTV